MDILAEHIASVVRRIFEGQRQLVWCQWRLLRCSFKFNHSITAIIAKYDQWKLKAGVASCHRELQGWRSQLPSHFEASYPPDPRQVHIILGGQTQFAGLAASRSRPGFLELFTTLTFGHEPLSFYYHW